MIAYKTAGPYAEFGAFCFVLCCGVIALWIQSGGA